MIRRPKKTKDKVIESLGYLDELEKQYDNPIDYFTKKAKKLTEEKKTGQAQCHDAGVKSPRNRTLKI